MIEHTLRPACSLDRPRRLRCHEFSAAVFDHSLHREWRLSRNQESNGGLKAGPEIGDGEKRGIMIWGARTADSTLADVLLQTISRL